MANKITVLIDLVTDKAQASARGFKSAVAEAEGGLNKFKAGASSAFASLGVSAGTLAVGAGSAIVAFGTKSVKAFEEAGIAAGKFSAAAGVTTEQASRLQEVAGDLGVSNEALTGSFVRMEKAISSGSPAVKDLGLEVVKTKDGQVDANATFLEAIRLLGGVTDANKKAEIASKLFGKGFADSAEILVGNADDIQKRLDAVSKQRVLSPQQVKDAQALRDGFKDIGDAVEALELSLGSKLAPELAKSASEFAVLITKAQELANELNDLGNRALGKGLFGNITSNIEGSINPLKGLQNAIDAGGQAWDHFRGKTGEARAEVDRAQDSILHITTAAENLADAAGDIGPRWAASTIPLIAATGAFAEMQVPLEGVTQAAKDSIVPIGDVGRTFHDMVDEIRQGNADLATEIGKLRGTIDLGSQLDDISKGFADITQDVKDFAEAKKKADDKGAEAGRKVRDDIRKQQLALLDLLDQYKQIPAQKRTEIVAEIATGDVDKLNQALDDIIGKDRFVHVGLIMPNVQQAFSGTQIAPASAGAPTPIFQNPNPQPAAVNNSQTTIIYPVGTTPTGVTVDRRLYDTRNGTSPR